MGICNMEKDGVNAYFDGEVAIVDWDECNTTIYYAEEGQETYYDFRGEDCNNDDDVTSDTLEVMTYQQAEDMVWEQFGELIECDATGVCTMEKDGVFAIWDGVSASISWDGCNVDTIFANGDLPTSTNECEEEGM